MTLRKIAGGAIAGTLIALLVDLAMQGALGAVTGDLRPMLLIGTGLGRLRWTVAAALVWMAAPALQGRLLRERFAAELSTRDAWLLTAVGFIGVPVAWEAASMLVMAARITMAGTWAASYSLFTEPSLYSDLVIAYGPWLLAGVGLLTWGAHLDD